MLPKIICKATFLLFILHVDYFELKATETLRAREELSLPPELSEEFKLGAWRSQELSPDVTFACP